MRDYLRLGLCFFAVLMICGPLYGQRKPKIKGNRDVLSSDRPLSPFSHLYVTDDLEVRLQEGSEENVHLEADGNLIDVLRFEREGDTLKISSFYTITRSKKLNITLTYQNLETIQIESGSVSADQTIRTDRLDLVLSERGRAYLGVSAALVNLHMGGSATSELNIAADSLVAHLADQSSVFIYSSQGALDFSLSGRASATLEGTGTSLSLSMTDNASLRAEKMEVNSATAFLNASSAAHLRVLTELAYEGREKSKLYVYGEPGIQILGFYDTAQLHKAAD